MRDSNHAEAQSREALSLLDAWLVEAARGFSPMDADRMASESRAHIRDLMYQKDLSEQDAVATLGNPKKANRKYKCEYLSVGETNIIYYYSYPTGHHLTFPYLLLAMTLVLIGSQISESGLMPTVPLVCSGLALVCSALGVSHIIWIRSQVRRDRINSELFEFDSGTRLIFRIICLPYSLPLIALNFFFIGTAFVEEVTTFDYTILMSMPLGSAVAGLSTLALLKKALRDPDGTLSTIRCAWEENA